MMNFVERIAKRIRAFRNERHVNRCNKLLHHHMAELNEAIVARDHQKYKHHRGKYEYYRAELICVHFMGKKPR